MDASNSFQAQQSANSEGIQHNLQKIQAEFRVKKILLDSARSFADTMAEDNKIQGPIKSLWVSDASDPNFVVTLKINHERDQGQGISLKDNMSIDFGYPVGSCALEFPAQVGKWIEVTYSPSIQIDPGSITRNTVITLNDGVSYTHELKAPSATAAELVTSETNRKTEIYNKGTVSVYIGPQACVQDSDYKNLCIEMPPGSSKEHSNNAALWARTETSAGKILLAKHQF